MDLAPREQLLAVAGWAVSGIQRTLHAKSDLPDLRTLDDDELHEMIGAAGRVVDAALAAGIGRAAVTDLSLIDGMLGTARARRE